MPAFARSADFAVDKPARQPCPNLRGDSACGIHTDLRRRGFAGCTVYDCFGAGQHVSQVTFGGRDWRGDDRGHAALMFDVFPVVRGLHELLWYLTEARSLPQAAPLHDRLATAIAEVEALTALPARQLRAVDADAQRAARVTLLREASTLARASYTGKNVSRQLVGAKLRRADLRGADLRGAVALGADLTGADLTGADVTGADLRGATLDGADLRGTLFLLQSQLDAATGDDRTRLPDRLSRPGHWRRRR